jgi:FAD-dependent urate hydroxylase
LHQRGFNPELVERDATWQTVGGGLSLQPNAMRALRTIGAADEIERSGAPLHRFKYLNSSGEVLAEIDRQALWQTVGRGCSVERGKLQEVLRRATNGTPCRLGIEVVSLKQGDGRVSIRFSDGRSGEYDLVVGADGIGSTVHQLALGAARLNYAGQMAWRSLGPIRPGSGPEVRFWLGDRCFFGLYPVSGARLRRRLSQ